jgi:hypothetical protein
MRNNAYSTTECKTDYKAENIVHLLGDMRKPMNTQFSQKKGIDIHLFAQSKSKMIKAGI